MKMRFISAMALVLQAIPAATFAVTLSGVMIYSVDHYGNPSAWNAQRDDFAHGQLWRTQLGGDWYGLGLLAGLPPANSDAPVLNALDFSIGIPLSPGENDFTLVGEPSTLTRHDDFSHFVLNLYFDGALDYPGISVLFPRYGSRRGTAPSRNFAHVMYALSLAQVKGTAETTYSDGADRVSVIAVAFLPPEKFGADYDKVSAHAVVPSSTNPGPNKLGADQLGGYDYVGVLKINLQGPSDSVPMRGLGVPAVAPVMPGVVIGPSLGGDAAGDGPPVAAEPLRTGGTDSSESAGLNFGTPAETQSAGSTPSPEAEATAVVAQTPTPRETAATTRTPRSTALATGSATADRAVTPTPVATHGGPTPAPQASATGASVSLTGADQSAGATPVPDRPRSQ
jgi:hypothetical protein